MLDGLASQVHLELNFKKSGLEAWRSLNTRNDPKTFNQAEVHLTRKDGLCKTRCRDARELQVRLAELEPCYFQYAACSLQEVDEKQKKHDYMKVLPEKLHDYFGFINSDRDSSCSRKERANNGSGSHVGGNHPRMARGRTEHRGAG